ncbi:MAG TPA: hypothetical protein VLU46_12635, partial [Thermoanaerobaculia bacterium]|nr:hypothetical protein [Thermoanaerobaculia bacterium]
MKLRLNRRLQHHGTGIDKVQPCLGRFKTDGDLAVARRFALAGIGRRGHLQGPAHRRRRGKAAKRRAQIAQRVSAHRRSRHEQDQNGSQLHS